MKGRSPGRTRSKAPAHQEITIRSWDGLVTALGSLSANWTFRGQSDATWPLQSTLARRFGSTGVHRRAWVEQETRILRIFKRKAHLFAFGHFRVNVLRPVHKARSAKEHDQRDRH